jgi:hypothetical protein
VFELLGEAVLQLECNVDIYEEAGATAADVCEGDLTSAIVIGEGANTAVLGLQIVTYSVSDGAGNTANAEREVTVADTTAPSIALLGDNPVMIAYHVGQTKTLPNEFTHLAQTKECAIQVVKHRHKLIYGTQFHPEAYHGQYSAGKRLLENFFSIALAP